MSRLELVAESQSQESGFLALADIASLAKETGIEYRVVGGLMVTLHLAVSGADDPTSRQTLDADLGVTQQVAADPALVAGLEGLGYERPESANRFIRQGAQGRRMVIDVLMPSYISRMKTNQRVAHLLNLDLDIVFVDTTSTYWEVEGADQVADLADSVDDDGVTRPGEQAKRAFGHSKDFRTDLPQVVIAMAVTRDGTPIRCWTFPGNENDTAIIRTVKDDLAG
jgi:hypothetical protein